MKAQEGAGERSRIREEWQGVVTGDSAPSAVADGPDPPGPALRALLGPGDGGTSVDGWLAHAAPGIGAAKKAIAEAWPAVQSAASQAPGEAGPEVASAGTIVARRIIDGVEGGAASAARPPRSLQNFPDGELT